LTFPKNLRTVVKRNNPGILLYDNHGYVNRVFKIVMVIDFDTRSDTWPGFGLVQFLIPAPPPFFFTEKISPKSEIKN
jgi:hypothetical protein